jgi:hypothetical protein
MKRSTQLFAQLSNSEIKNLTTVIKETIAKSTNEQVATQQFAAVNLWNIQRNTRSRTSRRFI